MTSNSVRLAILGIALLSIATRSQAAQIMNYWDFEGGYQDEVSMADGTAGSSVHAGIGHDGGTAAVFPGALDGGVPFGDVGYVAIDSTNTFNSGLSTFSMSYWFKVANDNTSVARGVFDFSSDAGPKTTGDGPQSLLQGTGGLVFRVDGLGTNNGVATYTNGGAGFEDDQWHFVVATYDPAVGIQMHVDGYGVDAVGASAGYVDWDPQQYLGAYNVDPTKSAKTNQGLRGSLDDVAIYSGILNKAQIRGLYAGTLLPNQVVPEPTGVTLLVLGRALLVAGRAKRVIG